MEVAVLYQACGKYLPLAFVFIFIRLILYVM